MSVTGILNMERTMILVLLLNTMIILINVLTFITTI